ncbi:peptidoglycan-binding domain-containing protein [Paracoccus sanguinis]|uniref:peptidoglycan-binding domain-containing protein n=1 Tax=Paracoccus sanguinis TaxID=1545044 RepID=UPI001E4D3ED6|nr:peptidoglycan-binding domain-containing protein [Paracoccus sanguinis]
MTATLPVVVALSVAAPALAEPVVLRIEAKRGVESEAAIAAWAGRFPNVVAFQLPGGWTGIGLGPMERAAAEAEMARLKAAGEIPGDSFIAPAPAEVVAAAAPDAGAAPGEGMAADGMVAGNPAAGASTFVAPGADAAASPEAAADSPSDLPASEGAAAEAAPNAAQASPPEATDPTTDTPPAETVAAEPAASANGAGPATTPSNPAPGDYLRLQRFDTREAADTALHTWRSDFPEAGLYQQPDGGYAITLGPLAPEAAAAWLTAFRNAERVGRPGAVLPAAELGIAIDAGQPIDLPGPGTAEMPALIEIQRALRWAGHYEGRIDGKDGPQTQAAIAAEVLGLRAAPDAASAMQALIDRRVAWNAQMGLTRLDDPQTGLSVMAPMDRLQFDRNEQGMSIYGPKDGSGAALILYAAPGGQQEMLDFTGLVTALGWVPAPERKIDPGHARLKGENETHIGQAEARVENGRVEGVVLIWPKMDAADQPRVAGEMLDSLAPTPVPEAAEPAAADASGAATDAAAAGEAPAEDAPPAPAN